MKFSITAMATSLLAAVSVTAAPTTSPNPGHVARATLDASLFNNFQFNQVDFRYLHGLNVNVFDLQLLQTLAIQQNLDIALFQAAFQSQQFNIQQLLAFQTLHTVLAIGQTGVLNNFDLAQLQLQQIQLGLLGGIGGVDLTTFIDQSNAGQIKTVGDNVVVNIL